MRLRRQDGQYSPRQVAWSAYLLTDDLVYRAVEKGAEKIGEQSGLGKKTLAYASFALGTAGTGIILSSQPMVEVPYAATATLAFICYSRILKKATEIKVSASAMVETIEAKLLKLIRLPLFLSGLVEGIIWAANHHADDLARGVYFLSLGVSAYLATSSTGMLDKAKEWFSQVAESIRPDPVHVRG